MTATMNDQPPLPMSPADAVAVAPGVGLAVGETGDGTVWLHGAVAWCWRAGDEAARRLAAVQLVETGTARQRDVAVAFGVVEQTVHNWRRPAVASCAPSARPPRTPPRHHAVGPCRSRPAAPPPDVVPPRHQHASTTPPHRAATPSRRRSRRRPAPPPQRPPPHLPVTSAAAADRSSSRSCPHPTTLDNTNIFQQIIAHPRPECADLRPKTAESTSYVRRSGVRGSAAASAA